jgi:hypothetical protein
MFAVLMTRRNGARQKDGIHAGSQKLWGSVETPSRVVFEANEPFIEFDEGLKLVNTDNQEELGPLAECWTTWYPS